MYKKAISFCTHFDSPESVSEPNCQLLNINYAGKVDTWKTTFLHLLKRRSSTVNLIGVVIIGGYMLSILLGFIIDLINENINAVNNLQASYAPILWWIFGWLFAKKEK